MAYRFSGVDPVLRASIGAFNGVNIRGIPASGFALVKRNTPISTWQGILTMDQGNTSVAHDWLEFDPTDHLSGWTGAGSGYATVATFTDTTNWMIVGFTWDGTAAGWTWWWKIGAAAWQSEAETVTVATQLVASTWRHVIGNEAALNDDARMDIAYVGSVKRQLTSTEVQTLDMTGPATWDTLFAVPTGWALGFDAIGTRTDRSGNGGNELSRSAGITLVADPAGWTWGAATTPVSQTFSAPYEATAGAQGTASSPLDAAGQVQATLSSPYDAQQAAQAAVSGVWEAAQGIAAVRSAVWEALTAVTLAASAPWEAGGLAAAILSSPYETQAPVAAITSTPWDAVLAVAATASSPFEALLRTALVVSAPWEAAGAAVTPVSQTFSAPWEAPQGVAQAFSAPWEAAAALAVALSLPFEAVAPLAVILSGPYEAQASVAAASSGAWEALAGIALTASSPWEALQPGFVAARVAAVLRDRPAVTSTPGNRPSLTSKIGDRRA